MLPSWTWVLGLLFGATIGSFLNVVIYRMPRGMSLSNPPNSFCPNCKHALGPLDLFPLFSWLVSGGKCRYCKNPVPIRYFLVELLNGSLWAGIWWQYLIVRSEPATAGFYALMAAALVAIIYIDWEHYIIPDLLNAAALFIGLGYHAVVGDWSAGIKGGLLGWGLLWAIGFTGLLLFRKNAMGHGDIKMMRGVGVLLGPMLLCASLGMAVILGIVGGVLGIWLASRQPQPEQAEDEEGGYEEPEPIWQNLVWGLYYLFCIDVVAVFFRGIERGMCNWMGIQPEPENIEEDDWKPSVTTIPFGPYLAAGAIVCMLFGDAVEQGIANYWKHATGQAAVSGRTHFADAALGEGAFVCRNALREEGKSQPQSARLSSGARNMRASEPVTHGGESRAYHA